MPGKHTSNAGQPGLLTRAPNRCCPPFFSLSQAEDLEEGRDPQASLEAYEVLQGLREVGCVCMCFEADFSGVFSFPGNELLGGS